MKRLSAKILVISVLMVILFLLPFVIINQNTMTKSEFEKVSWENLNDNAIRLIGKDWMLISAGSLDDGFNMMTASWGGLGWLWEKPVSFIFVRPQRYTFNFTEKEDYYTVTFYEEEYRDVLREMGTVSGRNFDKINYPDLTPFATENGSVAFKEAKIILECRKLYATDILEESFVDITLGNRIYPQKDFHKMYIGEIVNVWMKKKQ